MAKYKLKEGVTLSPFGEDSLLTNKNLTDGIAEYLISVGRASEEHFDISEEGFPPAPPEPVVDTIPPVVDGEENTITAVVNDNISTPEGKLKKEKQKVSETSTDTPAPPEPVVDTIPPVVD